MDRWLRAALVAADQVADTPALWLPGALSWLVTVGWIPLVAATWRPTLSSLTFVGSGLFASAAWPWNAVALVAGMLALVVVAFVLAAAAEATLLGALAGRAAGREWMALLLGVAVVTSAPALVMLMAAVLAGAIVAPGEFTAPGTDPGPVARIVMRIAPLLVAVAVAAVSGAALHAAAARRLGRPGVTVVEALGRGAGDLRRAGVAALAQPLAALVLRVVALVLATLLLNVLWAPIGGRLAAGPDAATGLLLVGFVAVWLCLVLGAGALQAWSSTTWSRILAPRAPASAPNPAMEVPTHR